MPPEVDQTQADQPSQRAIDIFNGLVAQQGGGVSGDASGSAGADLSQPADPATITKVGDFLSGVPADVAQVGENLKAPFKGAANVIESIPRIIQRAAQYGRGGQPSIVSLVQAVNDELPNLSSDEQKALATKLASGTAGLALGALAPEYEGSNLMLQGASKLLPAVTATGGQAAGQEISEAAGFEPDTPAFSSAKMHTNLQNFITNVIGIAGGDASSEKAQTIGAGLKQKALAADLRKGNPSGIASILGIGTRAGGAGGELYLARELDAGAPTFAKVFKSDIEGAQTPAEAISRLKDALTERSDQKQSIIQNLDAAAQQSRSPNAFRITDNDLDLQNWANQTQQLKTTGVGGEAAALKQSILNDIQNEFQSVIVNPKGQPYSVSLTFDQTQDLLNRTYDELRKLRMFDDVAQQASVTQESMFAMDAIKARIEVYSDLADRLRTAMGDKISSLEQQNLVPSGVASRFQNLNKEMHDLQPFIAGFDRFDLANRQAISENLPNSLVQRNGSIFGRGASKIGQAADQATSMVTDPLLKMAADQQAVNFAPNKLAALGRASDLTLGNENAPNGKLGLLNYGAGSALQAGGQAYGAVSPLTTLGSSTQILKPVDSTDLASIAANPAVMGMIQNDPDIPQDVKTQVEQSKNGSQIEKDTALGALRIAARNKGWFPPPEMQGIYSYIPSKGSVTFRDQPVLGTITDAAERTIYEDALDKIPNVAERTRLKTAFHAGNYVLKIPSTLKPIPAAEPPAPANPEPREPDDDQESGRAAIFDSSTGIGKMERVVHDH